MTVKSVLTVTPSPDVDWADLARTARLLARQADALGLVETTTGAGADTALGRLLLGESLPGDEVAVAIPLAGARVLHVDHSLAPALAGRVRSALEAAAGVIYVELRHDCYDVLVRHVPHRAQEDRALLVARRLAASITATDSRVSAGLSASVDDAAHLATARTDAVDAAALAAETRAGLVEVDQQWAELVLRRARRNVIASAPTAVPIRRLLDHDARHDTEFARTVSVWLANNQDTRTTAQQLCIHVNTLRYRLRRASELTNLDLSDAKQRLITQLLLL
ncbi:MAG TPA: helix-turn-helix domain-containing protein [Mycobacteriales bacterium]|nr:helix-turn-helix domain-containing protein [Mycobacteriales bacterium]